MAAPVDERQHRVGLVILAAGMGSRFVGAQHKLRAEVQGRPVLSHVIDAALESRCGPVAVITGAADVSDLLLPGTQEVFNDAWADGQSASLQAGMQWAKALDLDALVVGLGDQPFVPSSAWRKVADSDAALATATFGGVRRPPVRIHKTLWADLPLAGDYGARELLRSRPELVVEIPCEGNAADIDTREDLDVWN